MEDTPLEVYGYWYSWSDLDVLEALLRRCHNDDFLVVEVATGPNIAVPYLLRRIGSPFRYVSLDMQKAHIQLQRKGVKTPSGAGVVGDATCLPFRQRCVDTFVFHHAIDDILETRGFEGVKASIEQALSTLKVGGCMIFSHSKFSYDPYTLDIDLSFVQEFLKSRVKGRLENTNGPMQKWLLVDDIHVVG